MLDGIRSALKNSGQLPSYSAIREMSRKFKPIDSFKASKGWLDKFIKRNKDKIEGWKRMVSHPHSGGRSSCVNIEK